MPTASGRMTADEKREAERLKRIALHDKWAAEIEAERPGWADAEAAAMLAEVNAMIAANEPSYKIEAKREFPTDIEEQKGVSSSRLCWAVSRALDRLTDTTPRLADGSAAYYSGNQTSFGLYAGPATIRHAAILRFRGNR